MKLFNAIVFEMRSDKIHAMKFRKIGNLIKFKKFLNEMHSSWKYANIYDNKSKEFIERMYNEYNENPFKNY